MTPSTADIAVWTIAALAAAAVLIRPFKWPEAVWAVSGAGLLVVSGLSCPWRTPGAPWARGSTSTFS